MTDKFRIYRDDDGYHLPWQLDYPHGFDEHSSGESCETFELAIAAFIEAANRRCPSCDRGAVVDTEYGWRCKNCGQYDVAVGCTPPAEPPHADGYDPDCDACNAPGGPSPDHLARVAADR